MGLKPLCFPPAIAAVLIGQCSGQAIEKVLDGGPSVRVRSRYLLLDSRLVERLDNARLVLGTIRKHAANPLFREDKPWEPRFDNLYANVLYDEEDRLYKCWYSPFIRDSLVSKTPRERRSEVRYHDEQREMGVCYAVSRDGLKWEKPELGLVEFEGSKANNLLARKTHGAGVFKDLRETNPDRRYKMFYRKAVRFSPDGLRWSDAVDCREIGAPGDTHNNAFWAPELDRYIGITRLRDGQRTVGRTESTDFVKWTKATEVLRGDARNQTYAMPVLHYADVYLGFVMILGGAGHDRVHCELAWSSDTVRWERIEPGKPLIPTSQTQGEYDWGCVYAAAVPIVRQGDIRLYYSASNGPHSGWRDGFFCLATLRPDGFAGYEPADAARPATIVTRPVVCPGRPLHITADAIGGSVRIALLDTEGKPLAASEPISGDVTDRPVSLPQDVMAAHTGKGVRLRIEMTRAKVYSFSFGS
ncbi:MAG: hypothetical protein FJ290_27865 [Planctomycetes bacterium]|nr:hypothetical protein [Planctomycetota bacterium]